MGQDGRNISSKFIHIRLILCVSQRVCWYRGFLYMFTILLKLLNRNCTLNILQEPFCSRNLTKNFVTVFFLLALQIQFFLFLCRNLCACIAATGTQKCKYVSFCFYFSCVIVIIISHLQHLFNSNISQQELCYIFNLHDDYSFDLYYPSRKVH